MTKPGRKSAAELAIVPPADPPKRTAPPIAPDPPAHLSTAGVPRDRANEAAGLAWKAINDHSDEAGAEAELAEILMASTNRLYASGGH